MKLSLPALLLLSVFSPCFAAEDVHNVESLKTSFNNAPVGTELQLNVTQNIGAAADSDFFEKCKNKSNTQKPPKKVSEGAQHP